MWSLTPGQAADGPEGRRLIEAMGGPQEAGEVALLMDSAYEGDATRATPIRIFGLPGGSGHLITAQETRLIKACAMPGA